ncbi:hypothetical protein ACSBR2_026625 [Camellia fascicularis]
MFSFFFNGISFRRPRHEPCSGVHFEGLDICADTLLGDEMLKGISGGQKKRLPTVGPSRVLFMDEISHGLDSSTTYQIINETQSSTNCHPLERAESMTMPVDSKLKLNAEVGRTLVPKKPKANDPHKRDMTYEEKQELSTNLQSLPLEKLDSIVQIIKKRNLALLNMVMRLKWTLTMLMQKHFGNLIALLVIFERYLIIDLSVVVPPGGRTTAGFLSFYDRYKKYHVPHGGDEEKRRANYSDMMERRVALREHQMTRALCCFVTRPETRAEGLVHLLSQLDSVNLYKL